jgi:hypothetical protein
MGNLHCQGKEESYDECDQRTWMGHTTSFF